MKSIGLTLDESSASRTSLLIWLGATIVEMENDSAVDTGMLAEFKKHFQKVLEMSSDDWSRIHLVAERLGHRSH